MQKIKSITKSVTNVLLFLFISLSIIGLTGGAVYLFYYIVEMSRKLYSVLFTVMAIISIGYFIYRGILTRKIIPVLKGLGRFFLIFIYFLFIITTIILYSSLIIRNLKLGLILFPIYLIFIIYCLKIFKNVFFVKNLLKNLE